MKKRKYLKQRMQINKKVRKRSTRKALKINIKDNKSKTKRKYKKKDFKCCKRKKPPMDLAENLVKISPTTNGVGLDELHFLERSLRLNTYLIKFT